jgi:hypothetical protein
MANSTELKAKYIEIAKEITNVVNKLYPTFKTLKDKEDSGKDLEPFEKKQLTNLRETLNKVIDPAVGGVGDDVANNVKVALGATVLARVNTIVADSINSVELFHYTPNKPSNELVVVQNGTLNKNTNQIVGANTKVSNLPDDLLGYTNKPTVSILGKLGTDLPDYTGGMSVITSPEAFGELAGQPMTYELSFNFKLDRFPTRTWFDKHKNKVRTSTTRRTEIINFNYLKPDPEWFKKQGYKDAKSLHANISIGAVAPFSNYVQSIMQDDKEIRLTRQPYRGKTDFFSLAVALPTRYKFRSYYTDYKFQLGIAYNVKIVLQLDPPKSAYDYAGTLSVYVNGLLESTAVCDGKIWSKRVGSQRRGNTGNNTGTVQGVIASAPGFLPSDQDPNHVMQMVNSQKTQHVDVSGIDIRSLVGVVTAPFLTSNARGIDYQNRAGILGGYKTDSYAAFNLTWGPHKQHMNTGISYGEMSVVVSNTQPIQ